MVCGQQLLLAYSIHAKNCKPDCEWSYQHRCSSQIGVNLFLLLIEESAECLFEKYNQFIYLCTCLCADVVPSSKKKKPNDLLLELVIKRQVEKREERLAELEIRRQELALEREKFEAASAERNAFLLLLQKFSEK